MSPAPALARCVLKLRRQCHDITAECQIPGQLRAQIPQLGVYSYPTGINAVGPQIAGSVRAEGYGVRLASRVASLSQVAGCGCEP